MVLRLRTVPVNLPFGLGCVQVDVSRAEASAAWPLYVEFATGVAAHPLASRAGFVWEALTSVNSLFDTLTDGLRPFLEGWHTELRCAHANGADEELGSDRRSVFEDELRRLRDGLGLSVNALARIAGTVPA
ncbi:MAG TPA: hypothetical protein VF317_10355 [Dermatophilaceae bacterium]